MTNSGANWYVAHTHVRAEAKAAINLARQGNSVAPSLLQAPKTRPAGRDRFRALIPPLSLRSDRPRLAAVARSRINVRGSSSHPRVVTILLDLLGRKVRVILDAEVIEAA